MKHLLLLLLAVAPLAASVKSPVEHVKKMAAAQTQSDHAELYNLIEQASGKQNFDELLKANGGKQAFKEVLEKYFEPYDGDSLWIADSVEKVAKYRPEQEELLSVYKDVKEGFKIIYVGDSEKLSYYFFQGADDEWRMVQPQDYMAMPHNQ